MRSEVGPGKYVEKTTLGQGPKTKIVKTEKKSEVISKNPGPGAYNVDVKNE